MPKILWQPVSNKLLLSNELRDRSESFIREVSPLRQKHSGPLIRIWRGWVVHLSGESTRPGTVFEGQYVISVRADGVAFVVRRGFSFHLRLTQVKAVRVYSWYRSSHRRLWPAFRHGLDERSLVGGDARQKWGGEDV